MHVKIAIGDHARIGDYDVMLFTADGRSAMLKEKFEVLAAVSGPLYNVGCIPVAPPTDECPDETPSPARAETNRRGIPRRRRIHQLKTMSPQAMARLSLLL